MATRATKHIANLWTRKLKVASGQTATKGLPILFSGADDEIGTAGADSDLAVGVAQESGAAGAYVECVMFSPGSIVVLVGTGGATRGTKAVLVADGFTNATADNGGATTKPVYGIFTESGVAGDYVGLMPAVSNRTTT